MTSSTTISFIKAQESLIIVYSWSFIVIWNKINLGISFSVPSSWIQVPDGISRRWKYRVLLVVSWCTFKLTIADKGLSYWDLLERVDWLLPNRLNLRNNGLINSTKRLGVIRISTTGNRRMLVIFELEPDAPSPFEIVRSGATQCGRVSQMSHNAAYTSGLNPPILLPRSALQVGDVPRPRSNSPSTRWSIGSPHYRLNLCNSLLNVLNMPPM